MIILMRFEAIALGQSAGQSLQIIFNIEDAEDTEF